ncbi:MAG: hypothetical protein K0R40_472 [Burkholderiales bacterium]|jgi:hypothetical protein|nr:hypothetical protein [Burkholderiales bacterium]
MIAQFRRLVAASLIVSLAGIGLPLPAQAGMVATEDAIASLERARVAQLLDRADVHAQLQAYGVSPSEVKARVAALSDHEAAQLAREIDSLPAGGNALIGAIVLVFLVLLITDILGYTKVFPFTRSVR